MSDLLLLFDTETTGKADFNKPPQDVKQPRLVQLAALLVDGDEEVAAINVIVKPEGFTIPAQAESVHGISTAIAQRVGVSLSSAAATFHDLASAASVLVGHNIDFDRHIMLGEALRSGRVDPFGAKPMFCTMKSSTPICKLPGPYGFKWPRLSEVYEIAFKEQLVGAHDAMVDLRATWRVYRWLKEQKPAVATPKAPVPAPAPVAPAA